jgi:hypothetical protein
MLKPLIGAVSLHVMSHVLVFVDVEEITHTVAVYEDYDDAAAAS